MLDESFQLTRPTQCDATVVAPLINEFWRWQETEGVEGRDPSILLGLPLTTQQRALLRQSIEDVLLLSGMSEIVDGL